MRKFLFTWLLTAILFITSGNTYASNPETDKYTDVQITAERTALSPADEILIATEITLQPHWHIYWKNPGDSGLPVKIKWDMPEGFEIGEIQWPAPDKISYDILVNYGYYDQATLIQTLKTPEIMPEGKITLTATIDMLVCNEICIPESAEIKIHLNDPENLEQDHSEHIKAAQEKISKPINGEFTYTETENMLELSLKPEDRSILNTATKDNVEFFPHDWGAINHLAMPDVTIENGHVIIKHERGDQDLQEIKTLTGLLVIKGEIGQNKGFIIEAAPQDQNTAPPIKVNQNNSQEAKDVQGKTGDKEKTTWIKALYLALFGGMILNLMPCVFPVLSMKALSLVKMGDKSEKTARLHGIAYTLGVVLSFLLIGGILILLKEAGAIIGWGFQLQNPIVIATLAYLLFAIGLNLIGFFEFDFGLGNMGNKLTQGNSISSSFFTGTLATIVATPCTAPFMGTAMGFALTQNAIVSLSVFASLGFGLALPYLLLSFIPATRKALPKPGAWMNTFKQFLAFPMFASCIWLVWVLNQQSDAHSTLFVLLGILAIAFAVWLSHIRVQGIAKAVKRISFIVSILFAIISLSYINTGTYEFGEEFSQETLSERLKGNEPVFVEMTAAWCITCKINHSVAINVESTKNLFEQKNVQYLIGDWTNKDDTITNYLASFERNGVPLYVYYGARDQLTGKRPEPQLLPQILTPNIMQEYIGN